MKKYHIVLLLGAMFQYATAKPETQNLPSADSLVSLGYGLQMDVDASAFSRAGVGRNILEDSPEIDVGKALYGRIAGLNIYQGSGASADNISSFSLHGRGPFVLVDGFPRSLTQLTTAEIESITVLKDAVATTLYGVRGGNGIVLVQTRRGTIGKLNINVKYQFGVGTQFRSPDFADSYTYARSLNTALANDGLPYRYNYRELEAFRSGKFPTAYPNVDWWDEVYRRISTSHRLNITLDGGSQRFRYYTVIDYMRDNGFFRHNKQESRYNSKFTDTRLNVRANIDVQLTQTTSMQASVLGKINETNRPNFGDFYNVLYNTPSAAFSVRQEDGLYGGTNIYDNPLGLIMDSGNYRKTTASLLSDLRLTQKLDFITKGLTAEAAIAFDNVGAMYDQSIKNFRYEDLQPSVSYDGTLITRPVTYGRDESILRHQQAFSFLNMSTDLQLKIAYNRSWERHIVSAAVIYDQQSFTANGRNASTRRQSVIGMASYTFNRRYAVSVAANYSGSAYLPHGNAFHLYPAIDVAWILSEEPFLRLSEKIDLLKLHASCGVSGYDGNLSHELWRQYYGEANAGGYYFTDNSTQFLGKTEGMLPVEGLVPERVRKVTLGLEVRALSNRLNLQIEGYDENRSSMLVSGSTAISGVLGIGVRQQCAGEYNYRGFEGMIAWNDHTGAVSYGLYGTANYLTTEVVNENQEFQPYDYLYHMGDRVGQYYGLETVGIFQSQLEINNSIVQMFSEVRPGDLKYKDQNGDMRIDEHDIVKMYGSSIPRFGFGFGFHVGYKGVELSAAFQGITGVTVNLLNSPLYKPLVNNGNISQTLLDHEIPWSPETARHATMPRLTTLSNANNYQTSSFWLRDGSFLKLRNLTLSYALPRKTLRFAEMKVYLQGTNLFSLDHIKTVDPEQFGADYPVTRAYWMGIKFNF